VTIATENTTEKNRHPLERNVSVDSFQREFELDDVYPYIKTGIASIIEDEVTQRFVAEELKSWNLLTRTSLSFEFVNIRLTVIWIIGFIFRYCVLLPGRILILGVGILWLSICMAFVGHLPDSNIKKTLHYHVYTSCFQILGGSLSAVITYHNMGNKPKRGICVANHTSPIDVLILACDNAYALIGQMHGGFLGQLQTILSKCSDHIWFERSESKDRALITQRLREHVEDPDKLPILIFPEGTCINNTSVMQFKKGSFEVGGTIYPVAIKYDPLFGDAFWNSSKHGMLTYIYLMMTSWAIVCDVWYLPPMTRNPEEEAVTFANRVKAEIARQGGLVDLMWDGNLKRSQVKSEWKGKQQQAFAERIRLD
jgi:glycerol-3-phosphate O-acyltransferase 3/4